MNQVFDSADVRRIFIAATVELVQQELPGASLADAAELLEAVANTLRAIAARRGGGEVMQ